MCITCRYEAETDPSSPLLPHDRCPWIWRLAWQGCPAAARVPPSRLWRSGKPGRARSSPCTDLKGQIPLPSSVACREPRYSGSRIGCFSNCASASALAYDTTNFHTWIAFTNDRCELPQRGRNKQKRHDLRQLGLSYTLDGSCARARPVPLLLSSLRLCGCRPAHTSRWPPRDRRRAAPSGLGFDGAAWPQVDHRAEGAQAPAGPSQGAQA